ncbi:MAG TPA: hypothetical protein VN025_03470 [Candidatus Dormibacteraeota bacterium]|nr:hypothetical protein [Candidatus Dormibacteraeota bacterium]
MVMHPGDRWHCTNLSCRCTVIVESGTPLGGANPRCSCGSIMKKEFKSPVFSYLDFLKLDPPMVAVKKSEQD